MVNSDVNNGGDKRQYSVYSFAKINCFLDIFKPLENGLHPIHSIFQSVSLCDHLSIGIDTKQKHFNLSCNDSSIRDNLLHSVWDSVCHFIDFGLDVHLTKSIPIGAGLGGGSSNAAALLGFLYYLAPSKLSLRTVRTVAAHCGSDVPYFLSGGNALVQDTGTAISPNTQPEGHTYYLLIQPDFHISTSEAYRLADESKKVSPLSYQSITHISSDRYGFNRFESILFDTYPFYHEINDFLHTKNYPKLSLSGSGSVAYIGFYDLKTLYQCRRCLSEIKSVQNMYVVTPNTMGYYIIRRN